MGIVLFDQKPSCPTKKVVNGSFTMNCLFDGYLTEQTSYPQLFFFPFLDYTCFHQVKRVLIVK
jgi:hypothetical protein